MNELKLKIELTPSGVMYSSLLQYLRSMKREKEWKILKGKLFVAEGEKCWICGNSNRRLEAHEWWEYDDEMHVQKLSSVHHLCDLCHKIIHIGFSCYTPQGKQQLAQLGISRKDLIGHFCQVNGCLNETFIRHEKEAFDIWERRSKFKWRQDFGPYEGLVK